MAKTLNVLFIGNSFSARNDVPGLIAKLAAARGKELQHRLISAGGASLRAHWNAGEAVKAIQTDGFDFVVLQIRFSRRKRAKAHAHFLTNLGAASALVQGFDSLAFVQSHGPIQPIRDHRLGIDPER